MVSEMKKFLAVLFSVLFVFSACTMAFAANEKLVCDFCGKEFATKAELEAHINETFPVKDHIHECEYCFEQFTTLTAYAAHLTQCEEGGHAFECPNKANGCTETFDTKAAYEAHECEFGSLSDMFKNGHYKEAAKYILNVIIDFVKSDTFKGIIDKVVGVVKGIDFGAVFGKVKDIAGKIPFEDILGKIGINF